MIEKRIGMQKRIGTPSARPIIRTGAGYAVVNNPNYEGLTLLSHHLCVCRCGTMKTQRLVPFRSVPFVIVVRVRVLCSHGGDFFCRRRGGKFRSRANCKLMRDDALAHSHAHVFTHALFSDAVVGVTLLRPMTRMWMLDQLRKEVNCWGSGN
jgi:hypothetical protein